MNLKPLEAVAKAITQSRLVDPTSEEKWNGPRFDLGLWGTEERRDTGECGTAACVAGFLCHMFAEGGLKGMEYGVCSQAIKILGVDPYSNDDDVLEEIERIRGIFVPYEVDMIKITNHPLTPAMLIWMAENNRPSWEAAARALDCWDEVRVIR